MHYSARTVIAEGNRGNFPSILYRNSITILMPFFALRSLGVGAGLGRAFDRPKHLVGSNAFRRLSAQLVP